MSKLGGGGGAGLDLRQLIILAVILVTSGASGQVFRLLAPGAGSSSLAGAPHAPRAPVTPSPTLRDFSRLERTVERQEERIRDLELQVTILQRTTHP